jgi:hypothetical protein
MPLRALLVALALGTVLATGCAAHSPSATATSCYSFGVQAVAHHVTVTSTPPACTGLSQEQVNESVSRAIRSAVGGLPKAAARRLADADSRYLAALVRPIPAGRPASAATARAARASVVAARLAALGAWIMTAAAGAYLLAGLLGSPRPVTWRPDTVTALHAGLALTGLAVWIAYVVTVAPVLSWIALGITFVIAGLGMATLLSGPSDPGDLPVASPRVARRSSQPPVYVIAAHGALATVTILLVLLAAIGAG